MKIPEPTPADPKRLLIVLTSLCAEGTPVLALDLCRRFRGMGIEPVVLTLAAQPGDLAPEFEREGISVTALDLPQSGRGRYVRMIAGAFGICRNSRAQALLSMPFGWHAFLALGARLAGVPVVAAHVGNHPNREAAGFSKFRFLVQAGRPITNTLICCSEYVRHGVIEQFGVPAPATSVIYNGAEVAQIARRADAARAGRNARSATVIGMVARFEVHKDQPTLIRAAKLLQDRGRAIEVWLIGDGSRRAEYEALIGELGLSHDVKLLGVRRDVPELLGEIDVFAFAATPDEGQGVALVEAMAAGVPIVAADVGACREVLDQGRLGRLVQPSEPGALAAAISDILDSPEDARIAVGRAREKALRVYTIDTMAHGYARCLKLAPDDSDRRASPQHATRN